MSSRHRSLSDTRAQSEVHPRLHSSCKCRRTAEFLLILSLQHSQHDPDRDSGHSPYNHRPARGGMAPPPIPVDPAIDSWRSSNPALSPGLGLDNLLPFSPKSSDRLSLPSQSNLDTYPQELQLPAMKQNHAEPNPLLRFWTEPGPWNAQRIAGDPRQAPANPQALGFGDPMRRNAHTLQYEYRSPRSDIGSSTTGRNPLDSGYGGSRSLATSAPSVDQFDQSRSCHSLSGDVQDYHLDSEYGYQDTSGRNRPSPHLQYSSADNIAGDTAQPSAVTFELACQYPHCDVISKNQSEQR